MSTSVSFADRAAHLATLPPQGAPSPLLERVLTVVDPRMHAMVREDYAQAKAAATPLPLSKDQHVVLVGHRAAGKSRLLPILAEALGRPAVDLDQRVAATHGRDLREWVATDAVSFRNAERKTFTGIPLGHLIAAGGGFLAMNADLLARELPVLVPISFRTYRERLLADETRPRLRPELPLEEEIRTVYRARQFLHRDANVLPLGVFLAALDQRHGPERRA